jgi:hypothetical protein
LVELAEIQAAYYMVAATGVLVAAAFYILNLQMAHRKVRIDNTILYGNLITDKETSAAVHDVLLVQKYSSFDEWNEKYRLNSEAYSNYFAAMGLLGMLGLCVSENIVDFDLLSKRGLVTLTIAVYPKIKPIIMGYRTMYNDPSYGYWSEYLYNEVVRRNPNARISPDRARLVLGVDT